MQKLSYHRIHERMMWHVPATHVHAPRHGTIRSSVVTTSMRAAQADARAMICSAVSWRTTTDGTPEPTECGSSLPSRRLRLMMAKHSFAVGRAIWSSWRHACGRRAMAEGQEHVRGVTSTTDLRERGRTHVRKCQRYTGAAAAHDVLGIVRVCAGCSPERQGPADIHTYGVKSMSCHRQRSRPSGHRTRAACNDASVCSRRRSPKLGRLRSMRCTLMPGQGSASQSFAPG